MTDSCQNCDRIMIGICQIDFRIVPDIRLKCLPELCQVQVICMPDICQVYVRCIPYIYIYMTSLCQMQHARFMSGSCTMYAMFMQDTYANYECQSFMQIICVRHHTSMTCAKQLVQSSTQAPTYARHLCQSLMLTIYVKCV